MPEIAKEDVLQNHTCIRNLLVVVHTRGTASSHHNDNHWSIYMTLQRDTQTSIRMNMRQMEDDNPSGIMVWSEHDYWIPKSAIRTWELAVPDRLCVSHIAALLYEKDRDLYDFSGGGFGCRHWV
jgi:hypothetical protein